MKLLDDLKHHTTEVVRRALFLTTTNEKHLFINYLNKKNCKKENKTHCTN